MPKQIFLNYSKSQLALICLFSFYFLTSCKEKKENGSPCLQPYTIEDLYKNYDSLIFAKRKDGEKTIIWDTMSNSQKEGSYYVFDKNNNLAFYAYLIDTTSYTFGVTFDSLGHEIMKTENGVIRWFISKQGNDSLRISFLLFKINRSYGSLVLRSSSFKKQVSFFEGLSSNTVGADIIINKRQFKTIFLSGIIRDDCSMKKNSFIDSVHIPEYLTK